MIILQQGSYTKQQVLEVLKSESIDTVLPTTKLDVIIASPYGFTSYRLSKVRIDGTFMYSIKNL